MAKTASKPLHLALMRGINLGSKNKLAMRDLAAAFEQLGCSDVTTRGNTGNVLFRAPAKLLKRLPEQVTALLEQEFGVKSPVILRSHADLIAACEQNPFLAEGCDASKLHVAFLTVEPEPARIEELDPDRSPPDRFAVIGRQIYMHCPEGLARTKLSNAWFDSKLKTISTVRTWNVVNQLLARMG
ncbi:MAG TPA: DUF1697 domain-containing protein [Enhygromyxa sp.]|nr:DUF1697 domain-containing protein [Enhygromyxa sp.]